MHFYNTPFSTGQSRDSLDTGHTVRCLKKIKKVEDEEIGVSYSLWALFGGDYSLECKNIKIGKRDKKAPTIQVGA